MEKHFAVSGFVMNETHTKALMVFHKKLGVWVIPGGHLEDNEYPHEGAKREILEETGVEAKILNYTEVNIPDSEKEFQIPNPITTLSELIAGKEEMPEHIHMDLIFLAEANENDAISGQETEVEDVKWMTSEEIEDSDTFESVKDLARLYLEGVKECENLDS